MRTTISMKQDFYDKVKSVAAKKGMGISEFIRYAIIRLLEKEGEE